MIRLKRAYEQSSKDDGFRVLIDRLWPRGVSKKKLHIDAWFKEIAPSTELRKEFGHDPRLWGSFQSKYIRELKTPEAQDKINDLLNLAKKGNITLIYGAHDKEHNNAVVLRKILEKKGAT